uniref:Putative LAGLIDADG homing endonuclease n=1 Tax=Trebouxiophyceae sp. MX-AZ01 TaxID=1208065 RepID=J7K8G2_9CHLO|nr:putative LAGLIDADG homing endonuclease [Trebouxiophyceae sp. MX-AZ01]AFQ93779.1 putative LAGLIDADG homing endonuclease [Trebouxiophyceae sp. MX-AZ01]
MPINPPRVPGNSDLFLTPQQRDIAVGTLLGDASLQTQSDGKTWRLKWQMSLKHADYADQICQEFGNRWIPSKPHAVSRSNSEMLGFQTVASVNLTGLAHLFLEENGRRFVKVYKPGLVRDHLTNRGLAYWFMDDGGKADYTSNQGKGIVLNTHGFEEQGVIAICQELAERF